MLKGYKCDSFIQSHGKQLGESLFQLQSAVGNRERKMSAAGEQEERDSGSHAGHSLGECGATGLYWSLPGG